MRNDSESGEWQDWLVDDTMDQETALAESEEAQRRRGMLNNALKGLNERERRVFEARRLAEEPLTLEELSAEFGVSRERIRQIEVRAFEKVQKAVQKAAAAAESSGSRGRKLTLSPKRLGLLTPLPFWRWLSAAILCEPVHPSFRGESADRRPSRRSAPTRAGSSSGSLSSSTSRANSSSSSTAAVFALARTFSRSV